jgi:uncharacterized membrane protein
VSKGYIGAGTKRRFEVFNGMQIAYRNHNKGYIMNEETTTIDTDTEQFKLEKRIKSLRKSLKNAREKFIAMLPEASDAQIADITDKLLAYNSDAMSGVNTKFRLTDVQIGELELVLIDVEASLNTDDGRSMVEGSLRKATRIKSFKIGKLIKKSNMIPVSATWEVAG